MLKRNQVLDRYVAGRLQPVLYWDEYKLYFDSQETNRLINQFDGSFSFATNKIAQLRSLPIKMDFFVLTYRDELRSVMLLSIEDMLAEIINFETVPKHRKKGFATILINKALPLLKIKNVNQVIARDRTQFFEHPAWKELLINSHATYSATPYRFYVWKPDQFNTMEDKWKNFSFDNKRYHILPLDSEIAQKWFYDQRQTWANKHEVPNHLRPDNVQLKAMNWSMSKAFIQDDELIGWVLVKDQFGFHVVWSTYFLPDARRAGVPVKMLMQSFMDYKEMPLVFMVKSQNKLMQKIGDRLFKSRLGWEAYEQSYYTFSL